MRRWLLGALVLVAGCGFRPGESEAPKQAVSASVPAPPSAASAQQTAPPQLALQDITMADIEKNDLSGMGCAFVPQGTQEAVALLEDLEGQLKIGGAIVRLPADMASKELDYGTRARYSDGKLTLEIVPVPGEAKSTGPESQEQPATVTIHDAAGREVYRASGIYECAA